MSTAFHCQETEDPGRVKDVLCSLYLLYSKLHRHCQGYILFFIVEQNIEVRLIQKDCKEMRTIGPVRSVRLTFSDYINVAASETSNWLSVVLIC